MPGSLLNVFVKKRNIQVGALRKLYYKSKPSDLPEAISMSKYDGCIKALESLLWSKQAQLQGLDQTGAIIRPRFFEVARGSKGALLVLPYWKRCFCSCCYLARLMGCLEP